MGHTNPIPLSLRLNSLIERCLPQLPVWDLCCDHGHLGLHALASMNFSEVIFNDSVEHVIDDLNKRLNPHLKHDDLRAIARVLCSLAEDISEPLTGNVVIAGIGGQKILRILNTHHKHGRLNAQRLLLCPEKDAQWLSEQPIPGFVLQEKFQIPHNRTTRWILTYSRSS